MQSSNFNKNDKTDESNDQYPNNSISTEKNVNENLCKLFVGNIPRSATEEQLNEFFLAKGVTFKEIALMKDPVNAAINRGFGFFTLDSEEETDRLLFLELEPFQGKNLDIKRAAPKDCDDPLIQTKTDRVFVGGLPQTFTIEEITELFDSKYGNIGKVVEVIPKKDKVTGKSRGFCFVIFDNFHVVDKIMIDNRFPYLNNKRIEIRKASSDFPAQGGPPTDPHISRRTTPGGKMQRNSDRSQRMNPHPYRNGSANVANMRPPPRRQAAYVSGPPMHSAQYPKQTYGFVNRPPPAAYAETVPGMINPNPHAPTSYGSHPSDLPPYGSSAAASSYVQFATNSQPVQSSYQTTTNQYPSNLYGSVSYPVPQSGAYQQAPLPSYSVTSVPSVTSTNPSLPSGSQNHPSY